MNKMTKEKEFFCEGYKKWVFDCPKNYISKEEKKYQLFLILPPEMCYAGVGWCKLTKKEIIGDTYYG